MHSGPKINTGDLVFGYDTGLNINSNVKLNEKSRRFYKGKPTSNSLISEANWLHIGTEITNPKTYPVSLPKGVKFHKGAYNTVISWTDACRNFTDSYAAGTKITVSGWHMFYSTDTSLTLTSRARLGWHYSKDGTSTYGGTIYTATEWNKWYYFSNTFSSTGVTTNLRVEDGGYDYYLSADDAAKTTQYYCNLQIEVGTDVASPYSNGSRSNTDGLKDLTKDRTVNLSNMSFKSNGQPEFDGTDDYLDLGSDVVISPDNQGWTAEYVFNTNSASTLQHFNSAENDQFNANWLAIYNSKLAIWNVSPGYWRYGDTVIQSNTWYHAVFICDAGGTNYRYYINGEREGGDHVNNVWNATYSSLEVRYIGRYEYYGSYSRYFNGEIPVTKMYDRALSDKEVKQNFSSYRKRFNL